MSFLIKLCHYWCISFFRPQKLSSLGETNCSGSCLVSSVNQELGTHTHPHYPENAQLRSDVVIEMKNNPRWIDFYAPEIGNKKFDVPFAK